MHAPVFLYVRDRCRSGSLVLIAIVGLVDRSEGGTKLRGPETLILGFDRIAGENTDARSRQAIV